MKQRVVVTGIGVVAPNGIGKKEFEEAVLNGVSGVAEVTTFDTSTLKFHKGCEVKNLNTSQCPNHNVFEKFGRASLLANIAAQQAVEDSKLQLDIIDKHSIGVAIGTGLGEIQAVENITEKVLKGDCEDILPLLLEQYQHNNISASIARLYGLRGVNTIVSTACSAGNDSIIFAYMQLAMNKASVMLVGGVDPFSKVAYIGFSRLNAMSSELCRPFDKNRKGIIVGEGAAILVLETLESALERKAFIYGEILGYGTSCDAYHMTAPDTDENGGAAKAISNALDFSGVEVKSVDYICAHGTGTPINDKVETYAIKKVFGSYACKIPISSIKSMVGHTGGAASAIGAVTCLLTINRGMIPPTINYEEPDPECNLDYVPNESRIHNVDIAINNSFAFGGNNSCIVLKRYI